MEMEEVKLEIKSINLKINAIEQLLEKDYEDWNTKEKNKYGNHEQLRKEKEQLRKKEEQLTDLLLLKEKEKQATENQHFGRSYEHTFRISFIKALFNEGKGLVVSAEYFSADKACRKYTNKTDPELLEQCRTELKKLQWDENELRFEDIEMDCVLRCYNDMSSMKEFAEPAKILLPSKEVIVMPAKSFNTKISDDFIDEEQLQVPNSYIVVEISSNSANLEQKLYQLEKDLLFMLLRHRKSLDASSFVESIISYAFLVIPYSPLKKIQMDNLINQTLLEKKQVFPLLFRLYELGRFARFFTPAGMKSIMTEMSAHIADNATSTQLSQEMKLFEMGTKRIIRLKEELIVARLFPEMAQTASEIETELKRIITENHPLVNDESGQENLRDNSTQSQH